MADNVSKITYILEAAQATAAAKALDQSLEKIGASAKSGAAVATASLNSTGTAIGGVAQAAGAADPKIAALFASLSSMKNEITAIVPAAQNATGATSALVAGFGSLTAAWAFAIPVAINLVGIIVEMISAKRELIKVDEEVIATDVARLASSENMFEEYAREQTVLGDLRTLLVAYREATLTLVEAKLKQRLAEKAVADFQEGRQQLDQENLLLFGKLAVTIEDLTRQEAELNVERQAAQKVTDETVRQMISLGAQTGSTAEEVRTLAEAMPGLTSVMPDLIRALNDGALEAERFALALNKLKIPKFDESGTAAGIQAQIEALKTGLAAAARDGITALDEKVRFLRPTLSGLSSDLKHNAEATKGLDDETRKLITRYRELFDTQKKARAEREVRDITPQLEREFIQAQMRLAKEDFEQRIKLIRDEFALRRSEYEKHAALTAQQINLLKLLEISAIQAVRNERLKIMQDEVEASAKRTAKMVEDTRKWEEKANADRVADYVKLYQELTVLDNKFFEARQKREFAARSNRGGRAVTEAATEARQAEELRRVQLVFGDLNREAVNFELHLRAIDAFSGDASFLSGLTAALVGVINTFDVAQAAGFAFANAMQVAFDQAINHGKSFMEVFGKVLLAGFLSAIGQMAIQEGTYHILAGIAKLFNPFTAAAGAKEIAAGVALVAFGSALVAGASAITSSLNKQESGAGASGGTAGGGAPTSQNAGPTENQIPFPTSGPGGGQTIIIKLDGNGTKSFLKGEGVVTTNSMRAEHQGDIQRVVRKK
jgi:hypothetical protein